MARPGRGIGWPSACAMLLAAYGCGGRSSMSTGNDPDPHSGGDASADVPDALLDGDSDLSREDDGESDLEAGDADGDPDVGGDTDDAGDVPCLCLDDLDCADLEPCNGAEQCVDCACRPGIPPADGFPCEDGDSCTSGEACTGGVCAGGEPVCICSTDNDCLAYDDGDGCNGRPLCVGRTCVFDPSTVVTCDTSGDTACLVNRCVPASGECLPTPVADGAACDDGNGCTAGEACAAGACGGGTPICECIVDADCVSYEDGDSCNGTLRCVRNVCEIDPSTVVSCDPSGDTGCLANRCEPATGACSLRPRSEGASCTDGNSCTTGDACAAGVCVGYARTCGDGNPCTDDSCDPATGCVYPPNTAACDDGNACTTGDRCRDGGCASAGTLACSDGNICTDDLCDPARGCVYPPNAAPCDDGNACTVGDVCARGVCTSGAPLVCSDGNICTDDLCDPARGCVYPPNTAPCDDGDACTSPDVCAGGVCTGTGLRSWYLDEDGDGYGNALVVVCAATAPPGYADNPDDCCDADFRVNPAQTSFFTVGYSCGGTPLLRFDYNCDGVNERQYTVAGSCTPSGSTCDYVPGWTASAVPACGASAAFLTNCRAMMGSCNEMTGPRIQGCR